MKWIIIAIILLILVKTGSIGKVFKFLFRKCLYPMLGAGLGCFIGKSVAGDWGIVVGILVGTIFGYILLIKHTKKDIKGN